MLTFAEVMDASETNRAVIYEYTADFDGDWGEIAFDFIKATAVIT